MNKLIILILIILISTGCVSSGPLNNVEFESSVTLSDLGGVYKNLGDSGENTYDIYLSKIIWPNDTDLDHPQIKAIKVEILDDNTLTVKALGQNGALKEGRYTQGQDFKFENGKITINRESGVAGFKSGEPMLGLYKGNVTLGIDKKGHGKSRSSAKAIGMVYMVIPLAMSSIDDVRFERLQ